MMPFVRRFAVSISLLACAMLTACATGPRPAGIELQNVARDAAGTGPRWQRAEPALAGLRVWRGYRELQAMIGMRLQAGDVVQTGPRSAAVMRFDAGDTGAASGTITLDENTRVRVGSLEVFFGRVFANLRGLFETSSETVIAGVEGTQFLFEVARDRSVRVAVAEGVVACRARDGSWQAVQLKAGEALVADYPTRARPRLMPANARELRDLADWAAQVSEAGAAASAAPSINFGIGIGGTPQPTEGQNAPAPRRR
jgi:hypothetical protein